MPGLIQKSGYIKPGNGGGHYAEYIATREGVELIEAPHPSHDGGGYLEYMAQRPRSHGLFSADGPAYLEKTREEITGPTGPVWTTGCSGMADPSPLMGMSMFTGRLCSSSSSAIRSRRET